MTVTKSSPPPTPTAPSWHTSPARRAFTRFRLLPRGLAFRQLLLAQRDGDFLLVGIDRDHVAVLQERHRAADPRFRGDVADDQPVRAAGEPAVGDQADAVAQALTDRAPVTESISRMPGPPTGPSPRITTTSPALIWRCSEWPRSTLPRRRRLWRGR